MENDSQKPRLLFLSNIYPNSLFPNQGSFNFQQIEALRAHFDVTVLSPVPWRQKKGRAVKKACGESFFPTFWYTPGIGRRFYGQMMYFSIVETAQKLHNEKAFDFVYGSWLFPDGWVAAKLAQKWNIPLTLKVHGSDVNRLGAGHPMLKGSLEAAEAARAIVCASGALHDSLVALGAPGEKCHVLYNGINKKVFFPAEKVDKSGGRRERLFKILFVGNLKKTKGLEELAIAFGEQTRKSERDLILDVVGTGSDRIVFENVLKKEGVFEKVRWHGSCPLNRVAELMRQADLLCLPSHMEGMPNVVLEALSCDLPVIATAVGGIPELAGKDGRVLLVPPRDPEALTEMIGKVIEGWKTDDLRKVEPLSWEQNAFCLARIIKFGDSNVESR